MPSDKRNETKRNVHSAAPRPLFTPKCQNVGIKWIPYVVTLPKRRLSLVDRDVGMQAIERRRELDATSASYQGRQPSRRPTTILLSSSLNQYGHISWTLCPHGSVDKPCRIAYSQRTNATHVVDSLPFVYCRRPLVNCWSKIGRVWPKDA